MSEAPAPFQTETSPTPHVSPWLTLGLGLAAMGGLAWLYRRLTADPEVQHIREFASSLEAEGALVLTDLRGSARPPKLNGHIPDIFAVTREGVEIAIEVENDRSVGRTHARNQDDAFRKWERRGRKRIYEQHVVERGRGRRG